ncbi:MAG: ImmA/IrrE family metallo-endopeptidase [Candidatus Desulfaltia sp.]|nr:ImmA/IrrE family metallo-endopeptidase [Candidatus Desulfaltia sp.]
MEPNYAFSRNIARKVLKDYDLSEVPTDLLKVFKRLGLKYIELNDAEDIEGAILEIDGKPAIAVLNKAKPIPRQRFTLAHELGHIFLAHTQRDIYDPEKDRENTATLAKQSKPPKEVEADVFASELLVPYEQLKKHTADINNVDKLAGIFQVSKQAMTLAVMNFWKKGDKKKS